MSTLPMQDYWLLIEILALVIYLLIAFFLLSGMHQVKKWKNQSPSSVSVIVAARNEAAHLESCLNALARQNYPPELYQVIVVDDRSTDRTREIAENFSCQHSHMRCLSISDTLADISPKKRALTDGIKASTGAILLFTDADCVPGPDWIATTTACFSKEVGLVVGFSPLQTRRNPFWAQILLVDSIFSAVFYAGSIGWQQPFGATGRNLAYRRSIFNQLGGFQTNAQSLSGDDDLFVHQAHQLSQWQIAFNLAPESIVPAYGPETWLAFLRQKARHISAARNYPACLKFFYGFYHLANFLLWAGLFGTVFLQFTPGIFGMLIKFTLDWLNIRVFARKFNRSVSPIIFLLWQCLFFCYNGISGVKGLFGKIRWKEVPQ